MKKAPVLGALFILGSLLFSETIDLGKVVTYIETPTSQSYSSEDIQQSHTTDLKGFLESEGVLAMNTGGVGAKTNISLNGYAAFCIRVYVDGVLMNDPNTGEFDWNILPLDSIQSLDICYSPDDVEFAGACVRIQTKKFGIPSVKANLEGTSYKNSFLDRKEGSLFYTGYIGNFFLNESLRLYSAKNQYESRNAQTKKSLPGEGFSSYTTGMIPLTSGEFSFGLLGDYNSYDDGVGVERDTNLKLNGIYYQSFPNFKLKVIPRFDFINVSYDRSWQVYTFGAKSELNLGNLGLVLQHQNDFHSNSGNKGSQSLVGKYKLDFGWSKLTLQLGEIFFESNQSFRTFVLPQLSWQFPLGFKFDAYRQVILPTMNQLYYEGICGRGNPDLQPESGWGVTCSWINSWVQCFFQCTYYQDKIRWTSDDKGLVPVNNGKALYLVPKLSSGHRWEHFRYNAGVVYTRAILLGGEFPGNQIMWVPYWQGNAELGFIFKHVDGFIRGAYTGKRYHQNENKGFYEPYFLLDIGLDIKPMEGLKLKFVVKNLLDYRYYYHDVYQAPSRSISCSVELNK